MAEVACPQCGNPNLDVDAQNNVVYCRQCGFAVQVDPQTGNVTPLQQPTPQGKPPSAYRHTIVGLEPGMFLLVATIIALLLTWMYQWSSSAFILIEVIILLLWFMLKK
jgi:hypothetical protein